MLRNVCVYIYTYNIYIYIYFLINKSYWSWDAATPVMSRKAPSEIHRLPERPAPPGSPHVADEVMAGKNGWKMKDFNGVLLGFQG